MIPRAHTSDKEMMADRSCYPRPFVDVNGSLACFHGAIFVLAFYQVDEDPCKEFTSWLDSPERVFHLIIGSSNVEITITERLNPCYVALRGKFSANYKPQKEGGKRRGAQKVGFAGRTLVALLSWRSPKFCFLQHFFYFYHSALCYKSPYKISVSLGTQTKNRTRHRKHMDGQDLIRFVGGDSLWKSPFINTNDEDDEDEECSPREALLERTSNKPHSNADSHRRCCPFRIAHVGSRQKIVILVTALIFVLMIASTILIWIGMGRNPIDSEVVARSICRFFCRSDPFIRRSISMLCWCLVVDYGDRKSSRMKRLLLKKAGCPKQSMGRLVLFLKMRKVRSERASSEMRKVAGLAIVSVLCFTSSALVALFTDIPMLYDWNHEHVDGSSIPSAFVLWVMRELPPAIAVNIVEESRTIAFIHDSSVSIHPQTWAAAASSQNQSIKSKPYITTTCAWILFMQISGACGGLSQKGKLSEMSWIVAVG
ncbi:unnamed protein product [Camellia sinensis]